MLESSNHAIVSSRGACGGWRQIEGGCGGLECERTFSRGKSYRVSEGA